MITLPLLTKAAPILLPLVATLCKYLIGKDSGLLHALSEAGIDIGKDVSKKAIEAALASKPDLAPALSNHIFMDYTGTVLGALIREFSQQPIMAARRADLEKFADQAPEGWITFVEKGAPGLTPLQQEVFLRELANSLALGGTLPDLSTVPFITFFKWHIHLSDTEYKKLDAFIKKHIDTVIRTLLVSDDPAAEPAYKQIVLTGIHGVQASLGLLHQKVDWTAAAIARLENSPGFDLDAYARAIIRLLAPLPLAQIVNDGDTLKVSVADVFVPLMVREVPGLDTRRIAHAKELADWDQREDHHETPAELRQRKQQMDDFIRTSPAENALTLIERHPKDNFILLGEAGGGKTLLSRHLAVRWASAWLDPEHRPNAGRIPLYIELKDYARARQQHSLTSLLEYLGSGHYPLHPLDRHQLKLLLDQGLAYFILDGLDEVLDPRIKNEITRELLGNVGFDWDCILTSRIADFDSAPWAAGINWHAYRIDPLSKDDQLFFIQRYHAAFFPDKRECEQRIERLRTKLRDFHRLAELVGTPLLLTLLCLVNRASALPETRTELYEQAAELLLHNWDFTRLQDQESLLVKNLAPLGKKDKHAILRRLAWLLMMGRPAQRANDDGIPAVSSHLSANLFPTDYVTEAVRSFLNQLHNPHVNLYAELVPTLLVNRNSVLCPAGPGTQSFIHRTFLEFYAAWAWHEEDAPWLGDAAPAEMTAPQRFAALFADHWQQPAWRIILVLHLGRAKSAFAEKLLRQLLAVGVAYRAQADKLSDEEESMAARLQSQEALLLTAECFSETPHRGKLQDLDAELRQALVALAESGFSVSGTSRSMTAISLEQNQTNRAHRRHAVHAIAQLWGGTPSGLAWLRQQIHGPARGWDVPDESLRQLGLILGLDETWRQELLQMLQNQQTHWAACRAVIEVLAAGWGQAPWLRELLLPLAGSQEKELLVRATAQFQLKRLWPDLQLHSAD